VDRYEARRRRRRRGHIRLAVLVAAVVLVILVVVLLARGCGGADEADQPAPAASGGGASTAAQPAATPKPVSTEPPLVALGDTVRFKTPEGAVVRVTVKDFKDPGQKLDGVSADQGQRLVTLQLTVTPEGAAGSAAVPLPFEAADSFILIMENDELAGAKLEDDGLLSASLPPGESLTTTLAFSVGASPPVRFVCRPAADSVPVSATWTLD
jgi:hypothetical protein